MKKFRYIIMLFLWEFFKNFHLSFVETKKLLLPNLITWLQFWHTIINNNNNFNSDKLFLIRHNFINWKNEHIWMSNKNEIWHSNPLKIQRVRLNKYTLNHLKNYVKNPCKKYEDPDRKRESIKRSRFLIFSKNAPSFKFI